MIIGCGGSGKSTLATQLHKKLGLEYISLDLHYWNPGWVETPKAEWEQIVDRLSDQASWVMDGNYGGTMDLRIEKADTIIFLDFPTWKCFYRVLKRSFKYLGQVRPGLPEGCPERLDFVFFHYVLLYRRTRRSGILKKLKKAAATSKVFILKNDKQVKQFLGSIDSTSDIQ